MYTLPQCCILLAVSRSTLTRWLHAARMKPTRSAMEHRRFLLSQVQLAMLAKEHGRRITLSSAALGLEERVVLLEAQVAMLLADR